MKKKALVIVLMAPIFVNVHFILCLACIMHCSSNNVATLALGLRPKQRGCKVTGQEEARESHHILPGV